MLREVCVRTKTIVFIALSAALLAVCAWMTVPFAVPFTMQTFAVFLVLTVLGGAKGTAAIALYIAIGAVGLPVFSGFTGGVSALFGPTGGYIFGFLLTGGAKLLFEKLFKDPKLDIPALVLGLFLCYAAGTAWFVIVMNGRGSAYSFGAALMTCVVPYILPDALKLALAVFVGGRIKKALAKRKE